MAARMGVVAAAVAVVASAGAAGHAAHVMPQARGELDCNGFSPVQRSVKPTLIRADAFELTVAPWSSMNLCDPRSDPELPCTPAVGHERRPRLVPGRRLRVRDIVSGAGCVLPPPGVWKFGNMRNGNTFGRDRQWGHLGPNTRGAFVSRIRPIASCG